MKQLDIAVCGCGPAGLGAALLLHRSGHSVRIFERFDKPQPVGSGLLLQPTGLGVLHELGLSQRVLELGARIDRLYGLAAPGRVALDVNYRAIGKGWQALGVNRATLFAVLHDAVTAHQIEIVTGTAIDRVKRKGAKSVLIGAQGRQLGTFDLIVDALGANSPLANGIAQRSVLNYGAVWVNVPWPASRSFKENWLEQRYRRASHMAGLLPIGKSSPDGSRQAAFFWSLKRSDLASWRAGGIDKWKSELAALWPEVEPLLQGVTHQEQLTFAQYDHFTAATPYSHGLVHIGDSAHATSPQLGQGANMALLDALALSRALGANADLANALPAYARMRRWHVRLFQWGSAIFTPFYQSDSTVLPFLRNWITAPASRLPIGDKVVARLVAGMTTSPLAGESFLPLRIGSSS